MPEDRHWQHHSQTNECLELFVKPEAGKKGSVSLKKVKENKTEIKELQHIYGNWIKFRAGSLWKHDFAKRTPCEE